MKKNTTIFSLGWINIIIYAKQVTYKFDVLSHQPFHFIQNKQSDETSNEHMIIFFQK
jgi:hypothetical protein